MTIARPWTLWAHDPPDADAALVARALRGDRAAFDGLRRRHEQALRGFLVRRAGAAAADDIAQEVWLACWLALPRYGRRSRFKAWLYGIALHKCADYVRARAHAEERDAEVIRSEPQAHDPYRAADLREAVRGALGQLPDTQREVVELYYYAELTLAEIAQMLDRNLNTVKYQFYRAHAQVAEALRDGGAVTP